MADPQTNMDGESDLAILYPERTAEIAGRVVVMSELTFAESLRLGAAIAALVEAMGDLGLRSALHDLDTLRVVFADRYEEVLILAAESSHEPLEWVRGLSAGDGEQLLLLWWAVNSPFFLQRVLTHVQLALLRKVGARDGQTSSPRSSKPATTRSASATTPAGS